MFVRRTVLAIAAASGLIVATAALAAGPFADLAGSWRGQGRVQLAGGQSEALTCKAYYTAKDAGSGLGIALSCASQSNKIDLRATISSDGGQITGTWEERAFNSAGTIQGAIDDDRIDLSIDGTIKATMSITLEDGNQLVSIASDGQGFSSVDLELVRI